MIHPNVLITGKSNFDEENVKEMFKKCSTDLSCIWKINTIYKIGTLAFFNSMVNVPGVK